MCHSHTRYSGREHNNLIVGAECKQGKSNKKKKDFIGEQIELTGREGILIIPFLNQGFVLVLSLRLIRLGENVTRQLEHS